MTKYNSYVIEIIHLNGNKQIKRADNSVSYKSTLSLYKRIKEENSNNNVTINFVAANDEERKVLFSKKNFTSESQKRDIKELIDVLVEASIELRNRFDDIKDLESLVDKKKSNIEHLFVEAIDIETLTSNEKIEIFDKMRETILERRDYKILNSIRQMTRNYVESTMINAEKIQEIYENNINFNSYLLEDLISNENSEYKETHLIKEYQYKNAKEKINLLKQLEFKFDKLVVVEERRVIACYNKCKSA